MNGPHLARQSKNHWRNFVSRLLVLTLMQATLILSACHTEQKKVQAETYTVKASQQTRHLYFMGHVQPIKSEAVAANADGIIGKSYVDFGDWVQQGQRLVSLQSKTLENNYQSTLAKFLQAKDQYQTDLSKFTYTKELNRLGIISRDQYNTEKNALETANLNFIQARLALEAIIKRHANYEEGLSLENIKAVTKALAIPSGLLNLNAPLSGLVLRPVGKSDQNPNENHLTRGFPVKKGQALLLIGDMSGITVDIAVSEVDINLIQPKQKVHITGNAFDGIELEGVVTQVGKQAPIGASSGSLPRFPVEVSVLELTHKAKQILRVGMTAKVDIQIPQLAVIKVPLKAISSHNGKATVLKQDPASKQLERIPVVTGATDLDSVVISNGLKIGDVIIVDN